MISFSIAVAVLAGGGFIALLLSGSPRRASFVGAASAVIGGTLGAVASLSALIGQTETTIVFGHEVLFGGRLIAGVDPLSAFFLVPVFGLSAIGAIYGYTYLLAYGDRKLLGPPWFCFNLLVIGMSVVVMARDALTFLVAWEVMSLAAYGLVSFEHEEPASRRAGWIYLVASHFALALLFAMFLTIARTSASLELAAFAARAPDPLAASVIFLLAVAGFGIKAGLFPVHVWLPEAHAAAPSHVSALMSGVLIKMGVYGILRIVTLIGPQSWWGPFLMIAAIITGLVGISLALVQRDIKRVLAYSSVENVGIIFLGLGLGLYGLAQKDAAVAWLGFAGGLFHVWNHALMKGLLFLSAGSVLHGAGTKDMEKLGGLLARMPATGALMIGGAIAISALPPLNGFASEWMIYLGLMREGHRAGASISILLSVGLLALIGCLACFCFIRLVGVVLLGAPRSDRAAHAHESPHSMLGPMLVLALFSLGCAVVPSIAVAPIDHVITQITGFAPVAAAPSLFTIGILNAVLFAIVVAGAFVLRALIRKHGATRDATWGCGYTAPSARMQYTGASFSELLTRIIPRPMRPKTEQPSFSSADVHGDRTSAPVFAPPATFSADARDPLTRGFYEPFFSRWATRLTRMRWMQQGVLHMYLAYILAILIGALAWLSLRSWSWPL